MKGSAILAHVDHTLLKPTATWEDIHQLCLESIEAHTASVCIPASYVAPVQAAFQSQINICTVIGFPLGYDSLAAKITAAKQAVLEGAKEIDMVINLTYVKNQEWDKVTHEIAALKEAVGNNILKVIIETCYLTQEEKIQLCHCVTQGGADFIKTSTGFGTAGATHEDICLFRQHIGPEVRIKAAGGIHTIADMKQYLEEGCSRIGASAAYGLLKDQLDTEF